MRPQHGLSLIELLVGGALGLVVATGAVKLFVEHLRDSRRLLLEARLHQDLRAATDLIARDLRRAGFWQRAPGPRPATGQLNPYARIEPATGGSTALATYSFSRDRVENDAIDLNEAAGFRLSQGMLQALNGGSWQSLTDPAVLRITRLVIAPERRTVPLGHLCLPACDAAVAACPSLHLRSFRLEVHGELAGDARVRRQIHESVRVRNDEFDAARCP